MAGTPATGDRVSVVAEPGTFMSVLTRVEREDLLRRGGRRSWPPGARLFSEGDGDTTVLVLLVGRVKIHAGGGDVEKLVTFRGPGSLLGEISALGAQARSATAYALTPVLALMLSAGDFTAFLMGQRTDIATWLMRSMCTRANLVDPLRI